MKAASAIPSPAKHIFVDFENVHEVDLAVVGSQTVKFTLLVGPRQSKLAVSLVEKLLEHSDSVELVRLTSSGRNALDFTIAYYVGRAVAIDPTGSFHIVSKDKGYDPLIEHLRSRHIHAQRHDNFADFDIAVPAKLPAPKPPIAVPKPKPRAKAGTRSVILDERAARVFEQLRTHPSARPKNKRKLISFLVAYLGHKITEEEALKVVENLCRAGHLVIGQKDKVTYGF